MELQKLHWKQALDLLNSNKLIHQTEIDFDEMIPIQEVIIFNQHGIKFPKI